MANKGPIQFKPPTTAPYETYDFPMGYAGGINISKSADQITQNQSPDLCNMNYDAGGVPTKRYGFDAVNTSSWGTQALRGLFEFKKSDGSLVLLAAWNGKLYSVASDGTKTDLCTGAKASIADAQLSGFAFGGKFYFLTGTEYCYWDGTNPVAVVAGYVPTLLTECAPAGGGTVNEAYNLLSNSWKVSFSGTTGTTVYQMNLTALTSIDYVWVGGVLKTVTTDYTVDLTAGTVTFDTAPGAGTNNVIIQATKNGLKDATIITKCTFHAIYGGQNDTRVFFSGNPDHKNYRFQSGLMDPTYFPDDGDQAVPTTDADTIKGMGKMGNYLVTLTDDQRFWTDVTASDATVVFTMNPLNDEHGCCSWRTVAPAQNGLLCLSYEGVTWTNPSNVRSQLNTQIISDSINRGMNAISEIPGLLSATRAQMEAAWAYVYDNKYHLFVASTCWVLDLNWSVLAQGIYCWYPYTGLYASLTQMVARQDGLLWAGSSAGRVYKSNESYNDATAAIDAYWTSPMIFGNRNYIKKFLTLNASFATEAEATHYLYVYNEDDMDDYTEAIEDSAAFDFDDIDFDDWSFGSSPHPSPISEDIKLKGWFVYWKWQNNTVDVGMTIFSQVLKWQNVKEVA